MSRPHTRYHAKLEGFRAGRLVAMSAYLFGTGNPDMRFHLGVRRQSGYELSGITVLNVNTT